MPFIQRILARLSHSPQSFGNRSYYSEYIANYYQDASAYARMLLIDSDKFALSTGKNLSDLNRSSGDVKKNVGKPFIEKIYKYDLFKTKIYFYRQIIGGHKGRMQFHFYKDKLFYYECYFPYVKEVEKNKLIDLLKFKYDLKHLDILRNYVVDKDGNILNFSNTFDSSVGIKFCYRKNDNFELFRLARDEESKQLNELTRRKQVKEADICRNL